VNNEVEIHAIQTYGPAYRQFNPGANGLNLTGCEENTPATNVYRLTHARANPVCVRKTIRNVQFDGVSRMFPSLVKSMESRNFDGKHRNGSWGHCRAM